MKYNYFIASRWRNKDIVMELAEKIRQKGKSVYCFIQGDGKEYELKDFGKSMHPEEFMKHFESRDWQNDPAIKEVFQVDMDALKESDALILLLPAGKSAHIEAGVAYGLNKHCILIGEQKEAESSYVIFNEVYPTIETFLASM